MSSCAVIADLDFDTALGIVFPKMTVLTHIFGNALGGDLYIRKISHVQPTSRAKVWVRALLTLEDDA